METWRPRAQNGRDQVWAWAIEVMGHRPSRQRCSASITHPWQVPSSESCLSRGQNYSSHPDRCQGPISHPGPRGKLSPTGPACMAEFFELAWAAGGRRRPTGGSALEGVHSLGRRRDAVPAAPPGRHRPAVQGNAIVLQDGHQGGVDDVVPKLVQPGTANVRHHRNP